LLQAQLIAAQLLQVPLLISQLVQASLLLKRALPLCHETLSSLPIVAIASGALLLFLLPVTLAPVVVAVAIVPIIAVPIACPLLASLRIQLLLTLLFPVAIVLLLLA
jgi:hypothetical protein